MDVQLQDLIEKIKKDGIGEAESSAKNIISDAEAKAQQIIVAAEEKASSLMKDAKMEADRMEKASIDAIAQAGRNLIISFRDGLTAELSALIADESAKAYNSDMLKILIPEVVKAWMAKPEAESVSVLLSDKDLSALESSFKTSLKDSIAKGVEVKADNSLSNGFRIGVKDGTAYYDFSAEAVADLFAAYLNPKIAQVLKNAALEGKI
ncbi:MAG: V-type ATP synthase subunit E [Treponemataceae bacterium]